MGRLGDRQLTPAQASVAAAKVANMTLSDAGKKRHESASANLREVISADQAAAMFGASKRNVRKAKSFIETAHPDLVELVQTPGSKVSLDAACLVATKPKEELGVWENQPPEKPVESRNRARAPNPQGQ